MRVYPRILLLLAFLVVLVSIIYSIAFFVTAANNDLNCTIVLGNCSVNQSRLLGLKNDTDGFNNAHAQNISFTYYNYSVCCNTSNNISINITTECPGNVTVLNLSNYTNAHADNGSDTDYTFPVCLSSNYTRVTCNYPIVSCSAGYSCILSMANSEGANTTNAHLGNCSMYPQKVCCGLTNSAPTQPVLLYPADDNATVFERKINFTWSASTDPDGDSIEYTLNATCGDCIDCAPVNQPAITTINYTVTNPLCVDVYYNWTVTACDPYLACNTSTFFNFTIASVADITMIVNSTSFENMRLNENNDTLDRNPTQLVVQNTGNVMLNLTINATNFFTSVSTNTFYYQFEASINDTSGYVDSCSQTTFANISNTTQKRIYCNFSYDGMKKANIELNVTVPQSEPPSTRTSTIQLDCVKSE